MKILKKAVSLCALVIALNGCGNRSSYFLPPVDLNGDGRYDIVSYEVIKGEDIIGGEHYDSYRTTIYVRFSEGKWKNGKPAAILRYNSDIKNIGFEDINKDGFPDLVFEQAGILKQRYAAVNDKGSFSKPVKR